MRPARIAPLALLLAAACAPYHLPMPESFDAEQAVITGSYSALQVAGWQLSAPFRSTNARMQNANYTGIRPSRQEEYRFQLTKANKTAKVDCNFSAGRLGGVGASSNYVTEDENLICNVTGASTWHIDIENTPQQRLSGTLSGRQTYHVVAEVMPESPVTGFYITDEGVTIAAVQIEDKPRVFFARSLSEEERDALVPAIAALLMLDEKVHGV